MCQWPLKTLEEPEKFCKLHWPWRNFKSSLWKKKLYLNFLFTGNSLVFEVKCTGIFLEFSSTFSKILFLFSNFAHFAHSLVLHWGHEIILYLVALTLSNCALSDEWWWLYNQVSDMMLPLFHHSSDPPPKFWLPPLEGRGIWKI